MWVFGCDLVFSVILALELSQLYLLFYNCYSDAISDFCFLFPALELDEAATPV